MHQVRKNTHFTIFHELEASCNSIARSLKHCNLNIFSFGSSDGGVFQSVDLVFSHSGSRLNYTKSFVISATLPSSVKCLSPSSLYFMMFLLFFDRLLGIHMNFFFFRETAFDVHFCQRSFFDILLPSTKLHFKTCSALAFLAS